MTSNNANQSQDSANPPNAPDKAANRPAFQAVIPVAGENGETTWRQIGAAWPAKQQNGFNLVLTELPFVPDGKQTIYLRPRQGVQQGA